MIHTPGPWRWELNLDSRQLELCGGGGYDVTILDPVRWGMHGATVRFRDPDIRGNLLHAPHEVAAWHAPFPGREHHSHWLQDVTHPDARLIAAALELLEELEKAHGILGDLGYVGPEHAAREALIRKARGVKPTELGSAEY